MARKVRGGVQILVDFDAMTKAIGATEAMAEAIESSEYVDNVVTAAWQESENTFNAEAAAAAAAGAGIKHMFEWGTRGINRSRTNMRPEPLSERARLWRTSLNGFGTNKTLTYTFKPSVAYVPKPTRRTGMDSEVISRLRDHVFYNKAMVMETGMSVTIEPKEAKMLLFPFYNGAPSWVAPSVRNRGYTMHPGPVTFTPGASTQGNFTAYWAQFWEGRGAKLMNELVEQQLRSDFEAEIEINSSGTPSLPGSIEAAVDKEKTRVLSSVRSRARARARGNEQV